MSSRIFSVRKIKFVEVGRWASGQPLTFCAKSLPQYQQRAAISAFGLRLYDPRLTSARQRNPKFRFVI